MNLVSRGSRCTSLLLDNAKQLQFFTSKSRLYSSSTLLCDDLVVEGKRLNWAQIMGAANEFKEGDAIVSLAAQNEDIRLKARSWILKKTVQVFFQCHPLNVEFFGQFFILTLRKFKTTLLERTLYKN